MRLSGKRTMDVHEVAAEIGRSADWLYRHWRGLVRNDGFPPPVMTGGELIWSRVHLLAWVDRGLAAPLRAEVRAMRLAEQALVRARVHEAAE